MLRRRRRIGPWPGLTVRGRGFVSAGLSILGCGVVLGQRDLTRLAVFIVALPLLSVSLTMLRGLRLDTSRSITTSRLSVGEPSTVRLVLANDGRRLDSVMIQETVPSALGPAPRFSIQTLFSGEKRAVTYTVNPSARGSFELGPIAGSLTEPLGLATVRRNVGEPSPIVVYPRVVPLGPGLTGASARAGDDATNMSAESGNHALSVREYRHGDDLRRVHWRSTARQGELMVRADEQAKTHRATVLLDNRFQSYRRARHSDVSPFEWAVSMAASVCHDLEEKGYQVTLVTQDERGRPVAFDNTHLEVLAVLPLRRESLPLARLVAVVPEDHGPLVAIAGAMDAADVSSLASLGLGVRACFHLGADAPTFPLTESGWTVLPVSRSMTVSDAWAAALAVRQTRVAS